MKKISTLLLILFMTFSSFAQKNLFESLAPFEGEEFKVFEINYHTVDERFYIMESEKFDNIIINIARNGANKPVGLDFLNPTSKKKDDINSFKAHHNELDHYTQPAYSFTDLTGKDTYLMIDGIFLAITHVNDDFSDYGERSGYGKAYIPLSILNKKVEKTEEETEKKKVSFKDKMKSVKAFMDGTATGAALPESLKQFKTREEFEAFIDNYLVAMRKKQAANPYTDQDKKELAAMEQEAKDIRAGINKANADYWNSAEGQHVLQKDKKNSLSLYNAHWATIWIVNEDGGTGFIKSKKTFEFDCNKKWYYAEGTNHTTRGAYIGGGSSSYCQQTITINDN